MIISDLNYLENTSEEIFGGTLGSFTAIKNITIATNVTQAFSIRSNVTAVVSITGNTATAESGATATGNNTLTETLGFANAGPNSSSSNSFAVAVSG